MINNQASQVSTVLYSDEMIKKRVMELAAEISNDYIGKDPVLISLLKGAFIFTADLVRHISMPVTVEFVQVSSYGNVMESSKVVKINNVDHLDIANKDVLLVDTIVDTGRSLAGLIEKLGILEPASIKIAALLDKKARREVDINPDYAGFEIPDVFVAGYGMDYAEHYRDTPHIVTLNFNKLHADASGSDILEGRT